MWCRILEDSVGVQLCGAVADNNVLSVDMAALRTVLCPLCLG